MESITGEKFAVQSVNPAAPYIGGKRNLAKRLTAMISSVPHDAYAEPFVGMGGIFFRRTSRPKAEFINDYSRDVATFFRILQRHYAEFMRMLEFQLTTRADFERLMQTNPDTLTDLERAARFLYLQRTSFGGKVRGRVFGVSYDRPARFDLPRLRSDLANIYERLASVTIECLGYAEFIRKYDRPGTLFYLDPPYYDCENDYGLNAFSKADYDALRGVLSGLSGRFIMSINDRPEMRALYQAFKIEEVGVSYSVGTGTTKAKELIISNL